MIGCKRRREKIEKGKLEEGRREEGKKKKKKKKQREGEGLGEKSCPHSLFFLLH